MADNSQNIFQGGKDWNKITFEGGLQNQPTGRDIFQGAISSPKPNAVDETFQNYADEKVTREQYLYNRQAYSTNEDSLKIRQSWETTPHISIENGKLKLSGTQSFLESDTAKQLRAIFDEMKGQTYNTEALNQQIEAWNEDLQAMAKSNLEAVNAMDAMNKNIMENGQNEGRTPLTWDEFRRITQSAAVGRDSNAANSDTLIFVGYEWDDEGHQTPKYVKAKDFYAEFNNIKDEDKRAALSALYTQAGEGDAGAASKLAYLTGGQNTPVNVTYDPMFRFKDTLGIFAANTLTGLADAADFVTMWTFFGLPRQAGKVARGLTEMANGGDFLTGYGESDLIQQKIRDYREVVNWQNQYFMELTPGSTELAAMSGSVFGGVLGVAYSLWAGSIASQAGAQAASTALSKAGDTLLASGNGVARTFEINAVTGKVQLVQYMNGAQVVGKAPTIANGAASTLRATVVLPKGLYEAAPKLAEAMANIGGRLALETKIAAFSRATGGLSAGEREFLSIFTTNAKGAPTNIAILTGEGLSALRMEAAGLQLAARLAPLMGSSALRNVDNYYALSDESRPSDMSEYVIANTAKDVIAGAAIMGVGVGIHSLIGAANAAKVKPTRFMDTAQMASGNTQGGFYSEDPTWTWSYKTPPTKLLTSGKTNIVNKDIIKKATSVVSANGENFFFTQAGSILASAIPGALNGGIGAGVVTNNAIKQMRIEPAVGGANLITDTTDILTGKTITETQFYPNPDDAERELGRQTTPTVNPSTLMNSDLAATGNIVPFKIGGRSALKYLPNGVSRARIQPDISYLTPSEYATEVTPIVESMSPELRAAYEKAMVAEDIDSLSQQIYAKDAPAMDAPRLFVPRTEAEAIELAQSVARAQAVAAANPNSSPVMPIQTEPDDIEIVKRRRMVTDRVFYAHPASEFQAPEEDILGNQRDENGSHNEFSGWNTEMDFALGGTGKSVDVYGTSAESTADKRYTSLQNIIGKNPNSASLLRRQVGKTDYDLASGLAALWLVNYITGFGGSAALVNGFNITTKTAAKDFIASLYSGRPNSSTSYDITPWFTADSIYDLTYHLAGESRVPSSMSIWKVTDRSNDHLRMLDKTPGAVGEQSLFEYFRDEKGLVTDVVLMSPDAYFNILKVEQGLPEEYIADIMDDSDYYVEKISNEEQIDVPYLLYKGDSSGKFSGQEGRHRMAAAKRSGLSYVPVTITHPSGIDVDDILSRYDLTGAGRTLDYTDWISSLITATSPYGDPVGRFSKAIDKELQEAKDSIAAYNRVYSGNEPLAGVREFLNIVENNKEQIAEFISSPSVEKSNGIYNKVAKKAVKNFSNEVKEAISKDGIKANIDFYLPGYIDKETGVAHLFMTDSVTIGLRNPDEPQPNIHIPRGTKVLRSDYLPYITDRKAEDVTNDVTGYHYIVDTKNGYEKRGDGYYLNRPNGDSHKPLTIEFTPKNTAIYNYADTKNYGDLTNKLFKPLHSKGELHDIYKVILPGGDINRKTNPKLRTVKSLGTIPETNLTGFTNDLISRWDALSVRTSNGLSLIDMYSATLDALDTLREDFPDLYHAIDDKPSDSSFGTELRDIQSFLQRRINEAEEEGETYNPGGYMAWDVLEAMKKNLVTAALEDTSKFPSGLSRDMAAVKKMEGDASHESMAPWVGQRGMAVEGNQVNPNVDSDDFVFDLGSLKPGDDYVDYGFAFVSLNPSVPAYYANGRGDRFIIRYIGQEGTKVYYFGDQKNFADHSHKADGGALVIPRKTHGVVSSVQKMQDGTTIIYVVLDGKDGAYKGPIDNAESSIELSETKSRRTVEVEQRTPRNIAVTEYGLPKKWFSDMDEALDYKNESAARSIYKIDESAEILDRPPVTMDNIYTPSVRGEAGLGGVLEEQDFSYTPNTADSVAKFDGLMAGMETLTDSPTDYAQGIVDIARTVQDVFTEISKAVDVDAVYEDYARQIAEGAEQPTAPDNVKETFKPLTDMLHKLGLYFDPSGESLTKDFYLPTGAPSKKLASVEDAILHPERAVDVDQPVDGNLDDILVDPMRIGSSGFWEKRSGELFLDEDGNFTMAKAGTLEENLTAYVVSALTRGQNRLLVAANNEVARSKYDRNRNQITSKQALAGLKDADRNRGRIRAAQLKSAKGYDKKLKEDKLNELADNYSDKKSIDAIEDAYNSIDFAKEIDYTRRTNEVGTKLGYRKTLTINPIKGSALRFGSNNGFRGIANDIRKASHITVTGTKLVKRYGEYVCVGFGMDESQSGEYEFTRIEPAVNLGDSANLMFASDRAAATLFKDISNNIEEWSQRGGWGLLNSLQDFARQNFPLLSDPEYAAQRMFQTITRDYAAYNDLAAFNTAVMSDLSDWIKQNAARNINSAIEMADLTNLDDRTINAIDTIMTKAYVGTAVYNSKIVSALQRATYSATLAFNPSLAIGNLLSEPERIIDVFGYKVFAKALKKFLNKKEVARVKETLNDLPSRFADDREMVGLAEKAKTVFGRASEAVGNVSMGWLQKSEELKNVLFWFAAEENAKLMYPNDPSAQLQSTLRMFNDTAIAGGPGTTPGVANSNLGRMAFILKTFSLRNWDDFIEMTEQIGHSRSGSYKWDHTNRGSDTGGQGGYSSTAGKKKFNYKKAGQFIGGTLLRRYLLWLMVLGPLGRSIWDALGGDPTGLTENFSRGLYDDEGTDEYEGMTPLDNIINAIPTGFILGTLKDFYFAARRAGVDTGNFFGAIDVDKDPRLQKDLAQHLPLGTMTRRVGDMLELVDRGYSFNSFGNKTYAAPQNLADTIKGFMLGKSTTDNAQAYNKYRYGSVNIWGDIFEGDWLDFAMSANPFAADMGTVKMDTTRTDYKGVFHGSYNDVPTMQAAVADLRERRSTIIREYNEDLEKYTGQFEGLNDSERKAKATERREKKIEAFTNDVSRLVDAYTEAGNALSDKQINTLMYLFDFNEGDEDTYDSQLARERYVEAGLPDLNPVNQVPKQDKETGEIEEQNYFQRSLVYQNAVQGRYGIPREAAKAVDSALADFKNTYKEYKKRVSDLNDKAYSASKGSAERKRLQSEVEKVQEEYLNQLYAVLTPVVQQYGTEVLSSNDVIESLQPYMSSMVPYSSIKKYGLQFNSGNDIVWGQLSDWVKSRWGASAPTAGSDPEITNGIKEIKNLKDQGKISQAKSQARLLLDRIARGSLSARNNDVIELRSLLYD